MTLMSPAQIDPIRQEVIRNALSAIADEMGVALRRAAYSTNIKTRLDYSCAVFDTEIRMVAQAFTQPIHLGTLNSFVPRIIAHFGAENVLPGDGYVCNDGHLGGIHLNDVCIVAPAYHQGELIGYVATIAHHVDIGGGTPGSIGLFQEIFQEGLQIPPTRLMKSGVVDEEILSFIARNVRSPRETVGDFRAQVAGISIGQRRLGELAEKYGTAYLRVAQDSILEHSESVTRAAIGRHIPDGVYHAHDFLDDDGFDSTPVRIEVEITVSDGAVTYDLSRCDPQRAASINTSAAMSFSACAYTLRALLGDVDLTMNEGFYRCIDVLTEPGTVADAFRPAALGAGADVGARILEVGLRAYGERLPELVPADSKGTMCNVSFGGTDPRTGRGFAFYEAQAGGYGGRLGRDGIDAVQSHMQNTENSPIEEMEHAYPVSIVRYELIPDSGGAGRFRGGLGLRRDYTFEGPVRFTVMADRAKFVPQGIAGGGPALGSAFILNPGAGEERLPSKFTAALQPGDVVSVQIGGGGGWGDPAERPHDQVQEDLANELISPSTAARAYGVLAPGALTLSHRDTEETS